MHLRLARWLPAPAEEHPGLAAYTDGAMRESVRHIVGVQLGTWRQSEAVSMADLDFQMS